VSTQSGDATLDSAIDALYAGSLGQFVEARNRLARALDERGERPGATRIKKLRKPSLSAWVVNQLWWHARDDVQTLRAAADAVRRLQQHGAGPAEQTHAARRRRACLDSLLRDAEVRLESAGHAAAPATMRKVSTTLEALAAYGERLPEPGPGRLVDDLDPPGFDALAAGLSPSPAPPPPQPGPGPGDSVIDLTEPIDAAVAARRRFAQQALDNAEAATREAARAADSAAAAAEDATEAAQAAEQAYRRARTEAEAAARRAAHAENSWRRDAKQADALVVAAQAARERVRQAESEAEALRDALDDEPTRG
jgi:hypothetical protein